MSIRFLRDGETPSYFGLYPAIVTKLVDDKKLGRIEVKFPWLGEDGQDVRAWATLLTPYADDTQGFEMLPAVDSQVAVAFEAGNPRRPYVVGACWNGREKLPEAPAIPNDRRLIRTRSGSELLFDDSSSPSITLSTKSGHKLELTDSGSKVELRHQNGVSITFDAGGNVTVTANAGVTISAPSGVTVTAPSTTFTGSVTCTALTATSVTSPLYSQGAGNIW